MDVSEKHLLGKLQNLSVNPIDVIIITIDIINTLFS